VALCGTVVASAEGQEWGETPVAVLGVVLAQA
jgi:hypothetical protein